MEEELKQMGVWVPATPAKSVTGRRPDIDSTENSSYVEAPFVKGDQINNQNCGNKVGLDSEKSSNVPSPKKRSNNEYDMNETPRKRMKMKRHRPKVLDESKPKTNPKSNVVKASTPKPETPEAAVPRSRQPGMRKRVRKNNFKASVDQSKDVDQATTSSVSTECAKKSCKQKLDFGFEKCVINHSDIGEPNRCSHEHNGQRSEVVDQMQNGFQVSNDELAVDPVNSFQEITVGKDSAEESNSLQTHQRIFWPDDFLKNSMSPALNFPSVCKRIRTIIAKRHTPMQPAKSMIRAKRNNASIIRNHESLSELVEVLLPTENQRRLAIDDPSSFKCVLNLHPLAKIRKNRSQRHDLFNLTSILRRKRSNTFTRRSGKFSPILEDSSNETLDTNDNKNGTSVQVQDEGNGNATANDLIEDELAPDNFVHKDEAYVQVQDEGNGDVTTNDLIEEQELGPDNLVHRERYVRKCLPKSVFDNVSSRRRIINTCPAKYSLKLILRSVPPNLEKDYVLSSRDDVAYVEALINFAIRKLACLCIGESCSQIVVRDQKGHGALVPFKGKLDAPKKRKYWPKVHLDAETTRVWNLLMENGNADENTEEVEDDKAEYWKKERDIFSGRMELFITRMHQIQGDRRFSKWKGSVVDSVVGVFLTQNVSDHLSSSAFMSLVAKFPAPSVNISYSQESTGSNVAYLEQSANIENEQPCFFATEQVTHNQMFENGDETSICTLNEMVLDLTEDDVIIEDETATLTSQMEDKVTVEDETTSVKCQMRDTVIAEDETASVKCQMEDEVIVEDEAESVKCQMGEKVDFEDETASAKSQMGEKVTVEEETESVKCQMEDKVILEDETASVKCQESVIAEKCPTSSFNTEVGVEPNNGDNTSSQSKCTSGVKKGKDKEKQENKIDWDELRRTYKMDQTTDTTDSVDWEAVRQAPVQEVAKVIESRGMNNIIARRIKDFLDRIVKDHGSIDLEWLRNVPPDKAKDYLLSITGLGLKSVECVRLLAIHQHAFPVDTNVGRILVRLGWVPLQPLPEDVQIHLLNQYPMLDTVQKYVWPRLSIHDKLKLYEFHYQLITAGKVFCTKKQPNCNACPMRGECKHFASAFASSKLRLKAPQGRNRTNKSPAAHSQDPQMQITTQLVPATDFSEMGGESRNFEPIIEMPPSPEPIIEMPSSPEPGPSETQLVERDIEDFGRESEDEIPTIKLNMEEFKQNVLSIMENSGSFQNDMSKALVVLSAAAASIPSPKLKKEDRLRTVHYVYELPDFHPLLAGFEKREPDDPCPYLLAIWITADPTTSAQSKKSSDCQKPTLCDNGACCSRDCVRCQSDKVIQGTILIPCRTANRGVFPLNGTYFQVNEFFADHETSKRPIPVPRDSIWNLNRRSLCCGTSVTSICKGLSTEEIQYCFWRGFVCVRNFDRATREAKMLSRRFHIRRSTPIDN